MKRRGLQAYATMKITSDYRRTVREVLLWVLAVVATPTMVLAANGPASSSSPLAVVAQPSQPARGQTAMPTGANVAVIRIEGLIYGYHLASLQQRVDRAIRNGASLIVIELDTPGGILDTALRTSKYIRSIPVSTVAWVNPDAYSAGILIAAACQRIVMAPVSATGDCAPVVPGMNLSPTERAKALSPLLLEFSESAAQNGHDYVLFHAMCVLGIEVYQIRHPKTGVTKLVNQADYAVMVKGVSADGGFWSKVWPGGGSVPDGVAAAAVTVATEADRGQWELVQKVHDGTTLLTLSQGKAVDVGLAAGIVKDTQELQQFLGASQVTVMSPSRVALVAYWLTQPWVRALLIVALLIGGFVEMQAPGLGVGGLIAVTALGLLLVAPILVGLAQMWHVVLFFIGVTLLLLEFFVIPGFGIAGACGIACMFAGLILMVVPTSGQGWLPMPAPEWSQRLRQSVLFTLAGIMASFVGFYFLAKHFGSIPVLSKLILQTYSSDPKAVTNTGYSASLSTADSRMRGVVKGAVGTTITDLRPSGSMEINDQIVDVITYGEWIETGHRVQIVDVKGNRVVVENIESTT